MKNNKELNNIIMLVENVINEIGELPPQVGSTQPTAVNPVSNVNKPPADVQALNKAVGSASSVSKAGTRINTAQEFPEAFKSWFSGLGYTPKNGAVNTANVLRAVSKAMKELGYR